MTIAERLYTAGVRSLQALFPLVRGEGKLARGVRGRRGAVERMEAWSVRDREASRPLVWFHAPSVGEGLQARSVMQALRARVPEAQLAYTYFSPSAAPFAQRTPADFAGFLPMDVPGAMGRALDALRPAVVAFSKTEVWPNLTREAERRGVRLALLSATLPANSSRLSAPARALTGAAYRRLDVVAAIAAADAERYGRLGVPAARRVVMGDARFDQVWSRARAVDPEAPPLRALREHPAAAELRGGRPTLVAGSTWPADEERLAAALARIGPDRLRLVLAPHEPTPAQLAASEQVLARHGLSHVRLEEVERVGASGGADVVLVDRVGVLGELYALAELAYVGGGWGTAGLHSVLEPAAFGAPVLFGPNHANAREAAELVACGGAYAAADPDALCRAVRRWVDEPAARMAAGRAARDYVEAGLGAADRGAALLQALL